MHKCIHKLKKDKTSIWEINGTVQYSLRSLTENERQFDGVNAVNASDDDDASIIDAITAVSLSMNTVSLAIS